MQRLTTERRGHVFLVGLNRADKRNAFDLVMLRELAEAYTTYEDEDDLRCLVLHAHGEHFTAGLDLAEVGPAVAKGAPLFPDGSVDPLGLRGRVRTKPVVTAVQGWCLTIGIELALACDVRIAANDTRFGQIEINRGIFPFGGATIRLPQVAGWGNAMRWLLTGDVFDATEALRIGLVQEVTEPGAQLEAALGIAQTIAKRAPLGVRATIESSRRMLEEGPQSAADALLVQAQGLMASDDAAEGLRSFVERREASFRGR
ncbi:MAG: crotonase/enoyl-CoA hydratase family protein [Sandaracinus sp.]|nr:crotonase/enoyl-CoA hydratase family protein [Myxococcales bacterium]MCB9601015.1 crotonase/enoyl-CoA hydratase family protein [Sandaracinus sp.]MCB9634007.1 crotonase/enoyl-CoA hydratase family protein [Sandaracinus sp.]MCB9637158.1 crotonase/enoyl-CoA hydratase family protein [Sandaracinus sp.]